MAYLTHSPYREVRNHLPPTWATGASGLIIVPKNSVEFLQVMQEFKWEATMIKRHQNIHQYGMFLIRQQHLRVSNPSAEYVRVTRYCLLRSASSVDDALQFNLDPRRLSESINYTVSPPNSIVGNNVVLVVSFVTSKSNFGVNNLEPERDSDLYIEYAVYF